jgi:transposase
MPTRSVRLTDAQWAKMEPHLPRQVRTRKGGRPPIENRRVVEGILWILKTGARWRDLPGEYPSPTTCWRRLRDWAEAGVWLNLWRTYLGELDLRGRLHWENVFLDGTFAPAKKGAPPSAKPSGARVRSAWRWSAARVFLWECSLPRPHQRK